MYNGINIKFFHHVQWQKTFKRVLHHDAVMNPETKQKTLKKQNSFLKSPVSTGAPTAGQAGHGSTTFKAKIRSKGLKPSNKTPSHIEMIEKSTKSQSLP